MVFHSFLPSLELYINHIPRWWARIFSEYQMIFYPLFLLRIRDIYSPSPFLFLGMEYFKNAKTLRLQLWHSKAHYTLCIKLIIYEKPVAIVLENESMWVKVSVIKSDMKGRKKKIKYETIMSLVLQISSIIINIHFLSSLSSRCSIKTHKYFSDVSRDFLVCRKNHLFSHSRSKSIFILSKIQKIRGKIFQVWT